MSDLGDFGDFEPDDEDDGGTADASETGATGDGDDGAADSDADGATDDAAAESTTDDALADVERVDTAAPGPAAGIGVLTAADGLAIAEDERDTRLRAYVTAGNRSGIRIGTYLLAPYPDGEQLFCRIRGLEYARAFRADDATELHARRALRSDAPEESDFEFVADLDPLAVLYDDAGTLQRRMPDRVPKPETAVRRATDAGEIKTGLQIPEEGVFLGHLSVGGEVVRTAAEPPTIDYRLRDGAERADPLVFRHALVAGGTGSGKTHAAKNLLRQYLAEDRTYSVGEGDREVRPALVVFDPQDEYAQLHDDGELPEEFRRRCDREGIAYGGIDDVTAFVPEVDGASYAASHHKAEQLPFTIPFSMVRANPWLIAGSHLNDNQYDALRFLIDRFFREAGREGTYDDFTSFLDDPALREELDESGRVHEATFDAVKRRAHGFDAVFDRDARPITELIDRFVRPGGVSVVPTYHLSDSRTKTTVVLALASLLVDQKLSNDPTYERIGETPLLLAMDEAHNFLTDADSVQAHRVVGKFTDAAKQGRKERLGLFLVTQDPQDVADPIFTQVNTTICLNLGDEDAISAVNVPSALESRIPYMERGQLVVYSPDNSEPVEVRGLDHCVVRHGRD